MKDILFNLILEIINNKKKFCQIFHLKLFEKKTHNYIKIYNYFDNILSNHN